MLETPTAALAATEPRLVQVRDLTDATYVLRANRPPGLKFRPGQSVTLGVKRMRVNREYSIYSGAEEPFLDFLIREVKRGTVSPALRRCPPGEPFEFSGPFGAFVLAKPEDRARRYLFVATGTGIAPFHSFVRTFPGLDYRLLHGVRRLAERYDLADYERSRYVACVTGEEAGDFRGRVTAYLQQHPAEPDRICYLCGNGHMLTDVYDLLRRQGVSSDQIHTEPFF